MVKNSARIGRDLRYGRASSGQARMPISQPPLSLIARSMPQIGHVFRVFTMHSQRLSRQGAGDWTRKLADLTASREEQLTWDQCSGSYLKESWSLVR